MSKAKNAGTKTSDKAKIQALEALARALVNELRMADYFIYEHHSSDYHARMVALGTGASCPICLDIKARTRQVSIGVLIRETEKVIGA